MATPEVPAVLATRRRHPALLALLGACALAALALLATAWSLRTPSGSAWLLARVPGLQVDSPSGALLGDFAARSLRLQLPESLEIWAGGSSDGLARVKSVGIHVLTDLAKIPESVNGWRKSHQSA